MKKILHIIATPRAEESRTLKVSGAFLESFVKNNPNCIVDELNVADESLPGLTVKVIHGKYILLGGGELTQKVKDAWNPIERHIQRFLSAEAYLISAPMWNFSIPYTLKQYIDIIVQPKYLFQYTSQGIEGLVKNRKMLVITSRGGDYSQGSAFNAYDFQEPYLRAVFGFIGIKDITFINAQPMDALGQEEQNKKIEEAKALAINMAKGF